MQQAVKKSAWAKFGKAINIVVVLAFFLPFFGVSCDGFDVITVSGADMAFGCKPGGAAAAAEDEASKMGDTDGMGMDLKIEKTPIEPLAIVAIVLAIGGVALAFLKGRKFLQISLVVGVLTLGALIGLWVKVGGDINSEIATKMKDEMQGSALGRDSKVESGTRMGLWIALAGVLGSIALAGSTLKRREEDVPESVPPGGPQGPGASFV